MSVDLFRIQGTCGEKAEKKSRDQESVPALSWLVARKKFYVGTAALGCPAARSPAAFREARCAYAVLRGRTVKSRTCVRMLDICIPFSCETNGRISAMN